MSIIDSLPFDLSNGTEGDATQVAANSAAIVDAVNDGVNPLGTLDAPAGTRMMFSNPTAPLGWTVDSSITDHGLRAVTSGGAIVSGQTAFSAFLSGGWSSAATTVANAHLPQHTHSFTGTLISPPSGTSAFRMTAGAPSGFTSDNGTGGGGSHTHTNSTTWKYVMCVVASKN